MGGFRITEVSPVTRQGNELTVDFTMDRWTGGATQAIVVEEFFFDLGALAPGSYTFTVRSRGAHVESVAFDPSQIAARWEEASIPRERMSLTVWTAGGVAFAGVEFFFPGEGYRLHKAAMGQMPRMAEFFADTRRAAEGVVVGRAGWEALLEENQRRFADEFVARPEFRGRYPETMSPAEYVDALNNMVSHPWRETEAGALSNSAREQLIQGLASGTETRASVLRELAAHPDFVGQEFNRAFVLMQYFGYLRRDPDPEGFNFWLSKLNTFRGNFIAAEMVKAFLDSTEYRARFAPQ